ncbi:MAG: transposase [Candidatus Paceibacterota bacterium]
MSIRKSKFATNEIYHIYNRGVDKRNIFINERDNFRFIHDMYEFNDKNPSININNLISRHQSQSKLLEVGLPTIIKNKRKEPIVEILAYCLMDNHFHMLIRQKEENGITNFMRKLGTGYTNYFNQKYKRNGALFQGKFKSIHIENDAHFMYLPIYIHLNPLDFEFKEWRNGKISDPEKALEFLLNYRWSSLLDYIGKKNFPSIIKKDFLIELFGDEDKQYKQISDWIESFNIDNLSGTTLE